MAIDIDKSRERIYDFLKENGVGVLATVSAAGKPHAATIYFTFDKQLNLYFITKKQTQKSLNIQENPKAAIAVYDPATQTTVQAEGTLTEVTNEDRINGVFVDVWKIAFRTSQNTAPPTTRLKAGGYIVYQLSTPSLRMAKFTHSSSSDYNDIFEVVHTQPSL